MIPMDVVIPIVLVVAVLGSAGVIFWIVARRTAQQRTELLSQAADQLGFSFSADGTTLISGELPGFRLLQQGHSKKARNVMRKMVRGKAIILFDYQYTVSAGEHQHTIKQTVTAYQAPATAVPEFELRRETILHKIGALFGYQDIDIPSHPRFSRMYLLRGTNEDAIRDLFAPAVLEFFVSEPNWIVESRQGWLLIYRGRGWVDPAQIPDFLAKTTRIFLLFAAPSIPGEYG